MGTRIDLESVLAVRLTQDLVLLVTFVALDLLSARIVRTLSNFASNCLRFRWRLARVVLYDR